VHARNFAPKPVHRFVPCKIHRKKNAARNFFAPPPHLSKVNRHIRRFGQYKNSRRPHPSRRATWVFQHPAQVTLLTLAHPRLPFPHHKLPSSLASHGSTNLIRISRDLHPYWRHGSFLGSCEPASQRASQQSQNWLPGNSTILWVKR
jgi:hypothetical protein